MPHYIDLHLHSWRSDGELSPAAVVTMASANGFSIVSVCDHNTIGGQSEALTAGRKKKITVIPGFEFYTDYRGKHLHLLGYRCRPDNQRLNRLFAEVQEKHRVRINTVLSKLESGGFSIDRSIFDKTSSDYLGWGELIGKLLKNPRNKKRIFREVRPEADLMEIVNAYFAYTKPYHVANTYVAATRVIHLIEQAGGIPVLAHPGQQLSWEHDHYILALKRHGLRGLEVFTPYHNWHQTLHYQRLAAENQLMMTAGSDFHGAIRDKRLLVNRQWDYCKMPLQLIRHNIKKLLI